MLKLYDKRECRVENSHKKTFTEKVQHGKTVSSTYFTHRTEMQKFLSGANTNR